MPTENEAHHYYYPTQDQRPQNQKNMQVKSSDPFSEIRSALWTLLGLGGCAGTVMSIASFHDTPGTSIGNTMINLGITVLMGGALLFEAMINESGDDMLKT